MKVKELPTDALLTHQKVKSPTGEIGYIISAWNKGVWLANRLSRRVQLHPVFLERPEDLLEWELSDEEPNLPDNRDLFTI